MAGGEAYVLSDDEILVERCAGHFLGVRVAGNRWLCTLCWDGEMFPLTELVEMGQVAPAAKDAERRRDEISPPSLRGAVRRPTAATTCAA